jgi:hypothetical protein
LAAAEEARAVDMACKRLRRHAIVEVLGFDEAYSRARELLSIHAKSGHVS